MILKNGNTIHLQGKDISYIMFQNESGDLLHFYFGRKISDCDYSLMKEEWLEKWGFSSNENPLDVYPQEYPAYGYTDLRNPAYQIEHGFGNAVSRLKIKEYFIHNDTTAIIEGMPYLFKGDKKADTLEIILYDEIIDFEVHLYYTIFDEYNIIARNAVLINKSKHPMKLLSAYSADRKSVV